MEEHRLKIQDGGRLVIPAACRKALNLATGSEMLLRVEDGELRLLPAQQALTRARQLVRHYTGGKASAGSLIADRRREAKTE